MVTKADLHAALEAWAVAREKAGREYEAWGNLLKSHKDLIASMRANGWTWAKAQKEFEALSEGHSDALLAAWKDMDQKCAEYKNLAAKLADQTKP